MIHPGMQSVANQPGFGISVEAFAPILDVSITLTAELDRRTITFAELVKLEAGSVVMLNRPAGENIDLFIGDILLGSGEILVLDGTLAIRVADLRDKPPTNLKAESIEEESAAA